MGQSLLSLGHIQVELSLLLLLPARIFAGQVPVLSPPGSAVWCPPPPTPPPHIHTLQGRSLSSMSPRPSQVALPPHTYSHLAGQVPVLGVSQAQRAGAVVPPAVGTRVGNSHRVEAACSNEPHGLQQKTTNGSEQSTGTAGEWVAPVL